MMVPIRQPKVALQHPFWGDVSVQLPVPKAPLLRRSVLTSLRRALVDDLRTLPPGQIVAGIPHIGELSLLTSTNSG